MLKGEKKAELDDELAELGLEDEEEDIVSPASSPALNPANGASKKRRLSPSPPERVTKSARSDQPTASARSPAKPDMEEKMVKAFKQHHGRMTLSEVHNSIFNQNKQKNMVEIALFWLNIGDQKMFFVIFYSFIFRC